MKKVLVIIIIVIILIGIVITGILINNQQGNDEISEKKEVIYDGDGSEYSDSSEYVPGGSNGGAGADGGGDGGSSGVTSANGCKILQIAYSITKTDENELCNKYENESCIDKTLNCTVELHNLDERVGGIFGVKFIFHEKQNRENIAGTTISESNIEANERKEIFGKINVQGENADKGLRCFYETIEVPKKEVC